MASPQLAMCGHPSKKGGKLCPACLASRQNKPAVARDAKGRLLPGSTPNPGGRPKKLVEIERMLDAEHRDPAKMRETFKLLRDIAHGVDEPVFYKGMMCATKRVYDAAFMELYLNRVLGPVKELKIDLSDAPEDVLAYLSEKLN